MLTYSPTNKQYQIKVLPDRFIGVFKKSQKKWIREYVCNFEGVSLTMGTTYWLISFNDELSQNEFLKNFSVDLMNNS